jgi:hypothetical protein
VAELEKLATDALVAPTRIVVGEPDDQLFDSGWEEGSGPAPAPPPRRSARDQVMGCHLSSVSGRTQNDDDSAFGRSWLVAARSTRSRG